MASAPPEVGISGMQYALAYDPVTDLNNLDLSVYCSTSDRYPANKAAGDRHTQSYNVALMEGLGHFVMLEDPDRFNTLLAAAIEAMLAQRE